MNDVADILQTRSSPSPPPAAAAESSQRAKPMRKPKGISREVFALAKADASAAAALDAIRETDELPKTGRKFTINPSFRARSWEWTAFNNSARTDGVRLKHWSRKPIVIDEYPFVRFDKAIYVVSYTNEIYDECLTSETWTREDTDVLLALCQKFDMRWHVIADRWPEQLPHRSVIELRERYWSIAKTLINQYPEERLLGGAQVDPRLAKLSIDARSAIKKFNFEPDEERERLALLNAQFHLTKEQESKVTQFQAELQRLDAELKKLKSEKKKVEDKARADAIKRRKKQSGGLDGKGDEANSEKPPRHKSDKVDLELEHLEEAVASVSATPGGAAYLRSDLCAPLILDPGDSSGIDIEPGLSLQQKKSLSLLLARRGTEDVRMPTQQVVDALLSFRQDAIRLIVYESAAKKLKTNMRSFIQNEDV